jgi:ribonuclease VapC
MTGRAVFDSSAVLALLFRETGHEIVLARGSGGLMSDVSYSETLAKCLDRGVPLAATESALGLLQLTLVPFDSRHAVAAASLRPATRDIQASFADRACLATAAIAKLPVLTADKDWAKATLDVELLLIR